MFGSKNPIIHDLRNLQKIKIKNKKITKNEVKLCFFTTSENFACQKKVRKKWLE